MHRKTLAEKIWKQKRYYEKIREKENFSHPGFLLIKRYCKNASRILDVGAGDGSKLSRLGSNGVMRFATDISLEGLIIGKRKHPRTKLVVCEGEHLPFADSVFDRVTCLFVLEHTYCPERLVSEVVRVTRKKGLFFFLAPNFGAPNRASPNFRGSRIKKLVKGVIKDATCGGSDLDWDVVEPHLTSLHEFFLDADTTVEPYLLSLQRFLEELSVKVIYADSCWQMELPDARSWQKLNRLLGERGAFPFKYWGPHLFLVCKK